MTGPVGSPPGPVGIFDLIADFLERCQFNAAATAIRVQDGDRCDRGPEFVSSFRAFVDSSALHLAELEGGLAKKRSEQEAVLEQLIDGLLRKLMASGHALSDETLTSSIDNVLNNEVLMKLAVKDGGLAKQLGACDNLLGITDTDVHTYWEQIQQESLAPSDAGNPSKDTAEVPGAGEPASVPAEAQQPGPDAKPSPFYAPKRRATEGETMTEEEWDEADEYHDDDDPGYRIREIYEAELLAELSHKVPEGQPAVDELASCTSPVVPVETTEDPASPLTETAPTSPTVVWQGDGQAEKGNAESEEERPISPAFGESGAPSDSAQGADAEPARRPQITRPLTSLKYASSGDPFYPVELDGVVYDSFGLRVVFERDKTGFEESKEFPIRMNSVVAARYQILEYLGSAAFSRAVQCLDLENNRMVCMKIIKNDKDFFDQSLDEIKLLKYINVNGEVDENCVLKLHDYFYHKEHLIIVTELLRDNLYEFSKFNRECGDAPYFTLGRLQKISSQVLRALDYVHSLRLIHCDLKPENILIKSYSRCEVKVIDFGSSCFVDDHLSSYVQSRSYRAPEVMLGLPYDQKIDLWSLGCILAELWTGYVLFQNDSVQSLLARILGIIGDFPYHLMTRGKYVPQYFTQDGQLYQEIEGAPCPERGRRLHLLVPKRTSLRQRMRTDCEEFLDFLTQLLQLDPALRPTAAEALEHPFLKCKFEDGL